MTPIKDNQKIFNVAFRVLFVVLSIFAASCVRALQMRTEILDGMNPWCLTFILFDVDRGLCAYLRTPNNYGVMIDCGRSSTFSPTLWLLANEVPNLTHWNGYSLSHLIVTHPHDDHVEDINNVKALLPPAILYRQTNYDWNNVLSPPDCSPSENAFEYFKWQQDYNSPVLYPPSLGVDLETFCITPFEAALLDSNPQHLLNNSSLVTVVSGQAPGGFSWKIVIAGDNETKGWLKLLEQQRFRDAIAGADFFVTAHHGHESGFSKDLFDVMGLPFVNLTSERARDRSVVDYHPYARGLTINHERRCHLTTRCDGHIVIKMFTDTFTCYTSKA